MLLGKIGFSLVPMSGKTGSGVISTARRSNRKIFLKGRKLCHMDGQDKFSGLIYQIGNHQQSL